MTATSRRLGSLPRTAIGLGRAGDSGRCGTIARCARIGQRAGLSVGGGTRNGRPTGSDRPQSSVTVGSVQGLDVIQRSRSALEITDTELRLIAAAAIIGLKRTPNTG